MRLTINYLEDQKEEEKVYPVKERLYLDKKNRITTNPEKAEFLYRAKGQYVVKRDIEAYPELKNYIIDPNKPQPKPVVKEEKKEVPDGTNKRGRPPKNDKKDDEVENK